MPRAGILSALPRVQHLDQFIAGTQRWRVSVAALNYRVHKLGITSDWKNRDFCIEIARKGYNRDEPNEIERERSIVWEKVLKALWAEKTTHFDMAKELFLPVSEVSDLLFGVLNTVGPGAAMQLKPLSVVSEEELEEPKAGA
jgi:hypothetical protein